MEARLRTCDDAIWDVAGDVNARRTSEASSKVSWTVLGLDGGSWTSRWRKAWTAPANSQGFDDRVRSVRETGSRE